MTESPHLCMYAHLHCMSHSLSVRLGYPTTLLCIGHGALFRVCWVAHPCAPLKGHQKITAPSHMVAVPGLLAGQSYLYRSTRKISSSLETEALMWMLKGRV